MNRQMIICGEEELYVLRLADMIAERGELDLQIQVCTSFEQAEALEEIHCAEIMIIGEEIPYEKRKESRAAKRFVLVGQEGREVGEEETSVYKYQSVSKIFSRIMEVCLDMDKAGMFQVPHRTGQSLIAVYSPIHRIGKTAFARKLGRELGKKGPVLYLNMQEYPGTAEEDRDRPTLADLIYYSRQERNHLGLRISSMVYQREGMDILAPIPVSQDLKEVEEGEWGILLSQILQKGPYQYIILDLSESVHGLWEILKMSDTWYLPFIQEEAEERKMDQFFETLDKLGYSALAGRARMVEMRGGAEGCAKRALQYDKVSTHGKASGADHGEDGSVERNRGWRTGRIDLSGAGRVHKRPLSSFEDKDGVW